MSWSTISPPMRPAINVLDNALKKALDQQTDLGSVQSRLGYTSANIVTASENTTNAMSVIRDADVLVDQLYSYTPAMNALAAMARGTVVIGGGEEMPSTAWSKAVCSAQNLLLSIRTSRYLLIPAQRTRSRSARS